jgi:hypothetical protein
MRIFCKRNFLPTSSSSKEYSSGNPSSSSLPSVSPVVGSTSITYFVTYNIHTYDTKDSI